MQLRLAAGGLLTAGGLVVALGQGLLVLATSNAANVTFNAQVQTSCTISSQSTGNFGYDPGQATDTKIGPIGSANVTCTVGTTPTALTLDEGAHKCTAAGAPSAACPAISSPSQPARTMLNGSSNLAYNIFASAANQTTGTPAAAWGTLNGPALVAGTGASQTYQFFLTIPKNQELPPAIYSDTVVETISF